MRDNSHCFPCCPRGTALISKISRAILARTIAQRKIGSGKETRGKERVDPVKVEDTFAYGRKKLKSRASVRNGIRSRGAVSATFSIPVSLSLSLSHAFVKERYYETQCAFWYARCGRSIAPAPDITSRTVSNLTQKSSRKSKRERERLARLINRSVTRGATETADIDLPIYARVPTRK